MNIGVIGLGYVGLPSSVILAFNGNNIIALDNNIEKLSKLNESIMPIYEPQLLEYYQKVFNKNLKLTNNLSELMYKTDIIYVCVPTPMSKNGKADLKYIFEVVNNIAKLKINKPKVLVIKSTVPVGTCDKVEQIFKNVNKNIKVVFIPEFLQEGNAIANLLNPDRVIIGLNNTNKELEKIFNEIYKNYKNVIFTSRRSAELIKYASNGFLATKISFINEIADLCEKCGANVWEVSKGIGLDKRIGSLFLNASVGYGGSCFPKDTSALALFAKDFNCDLSIIKQVIKSNDNRIKKIPKKICKIIKNSKNILFLGLAFKGGTSDLRESPSIKIINEVYKRIKNKANISIYDPYNARYPDNNLFQGDNLQELIKRADAIVVLTRDNFWKENIANIEKCNIIIDYSGLLSKMDFKNNIKFYQIGVNNDR